MKLPPCSFLLFALPGFFGCHAPLRPPAGSVVVPASPASPQNRPLAATAAANYPAEYEEYYVGMIPDPEDPRFAYHPGTLTVERRPARPRLAGDMMQIVPVFHRGPATSAGMADDHPEPASEELASLAVRSHRVIVALREENRQLQARLAARAAPPETPDPADAQEDEEPAAGPAPTATATVAPTASTPPASEAGDTFSLVRPNAENVIELDPALFAAPATASQNPFVQRYQPAPQWRELTLLISAAVPGPNPSAVINDTPFSLHSQIQDLELYRIEADTIYLRKDNFLLVCPVSERPLRVRLP